MVAEIVFTKERAEKLHSEIATFKKRSTKPACSLLNQEKHVSVKVLL